MNKNLNSNERKLLNKLNRRAKLINQLMELVDGQSTHPPLNALDKYSNQQLEALIRKQTTFNLVYDKPLNLN